MPSLNIRNVEPDLLVRLKVAAATRGIPARELVIEAIEAQLKKESVAAP